MELSKPGKQCIKTIAALGLECCIWAAGTMLLHTAGTVAVYHTHQKDCGDDMSNRIVHE